jgi:hypothetical protein
MAFDSISKRISGTAQSGTGLLAVFCDLAPEWRTDFRPWLADDMFPPRVAIGFGPAASFDVIEDATLGAVADPERKPQAYVTCYVAPTLGDLYGAAYQSLRVKRAPRDAAYHQRMQNQARYAAAWVGPGIESDDRHFAPVIVIDRFDITPGEIQGFNIWYESEFLPACADIPGLKRLRRYLAMEGPERHHLVTEFASEQDLDDSAWRTLRASGQWDCCRFAQGAPAAYRKVLDADPETR